MAVSVWLALMNKTHVQLFKLHMSFFMIQMRFSKKREI